MKTGGRVEMRRALDREMRPFREAAKEENPTRPLLRAVRQALGIPVAEIAEELEVRPSVVFALEESERKGTISTRSLRLVAEAMGCKVVYGIVPEGGKTLRELAEERE
jgi:transcriptional regulator with XRE-family HTH domain